MAKLTDSEWSRIKAKWLTRKYSNREIGSQFGVSHAAIQKRAKKEGWEQIDEAVIDKAVDARAALKKEVSKVSMVSKVETKALEVEIDRLAELKTALEDGAIAIIKKTSDMVDAAAEPDDIKKLAEANTKINDSYFNPRQAQVAIQNNQAQQQGMRIEGYEVEVIESKG